MLIVFLKIFNHNYSIGLTIANGSMAETFSGTNYPDYWVSVKGPLEMNFVAGINDGYAGFELDYVCKKDQSKSL